MKHRRRESHTVNASIIFSPVTPATIQQPETL
jgi:hypothetical protein